MKNKQCYLCLGLFLLLFSFSAHAKLLYAWVELGDNTQQIVRAIVTDSTCPNITIDDQNQPMQVFAKANKKFPVTSCEYRLSQAAKKIAIDQQPLPSFINMPKRIAIIGDTGCLPLFQSCDDPNAWPFAKIAQQIAKQKPDLIIHTGDILYRELPCAPWVKNCSNTPWGDNWLSWETDFFKPAKILLETAPWVMIRGNHEKCSRAGEGWQRFFSVFEFGQCDNHDKPYVVKLPQLQLIVFDSSAAKDSLDEERLATYQKQFASIKKSLNDIPTWFLAHHPLWTFTRSHLGKHKESTKELQIMTNNQFPEQVKLVLSGHVHSAGVLHFDHTRPTQVIVGHSGAPLSGKHWLTREAYDFATTFDQKEIAGKKIKEGFWRNGFGFMMAEYENGQWQLTDYDVDGKVMNRFQLAAL